MSLKEDIKKLAAEQKSLKNQRKTKNLIGQRTVEPWRATMKVQYNKQVLTDMYHVYAILRGKNSPYEVEQLDHSTVNDLFAKYGVVETLN